MKHVGMFIACLFTFIAAKPQAMISGLVKNEDGDPLTGCNVLIKGTYLGTSTDKEGKFRFEKIQPGEYVLKASYIGYEDREKEIKVTDRTSVEFIMEESLFMGDEVIVSATRATDKTPVAYSNVKHSELEKKNLGQDLPYMLSMTPSLVTSSDAGAGVGYTSFRIRGTDLNRINVMVNGIPVNDAESHGVWWVNMPDFVTSVDNIQVQRGVGTSVNGAASFGATVNLQTTTLEKESYAEVHSTAGSFNTFKNSLSVGSGLINERFTFDARLSKVNSDGFIDRAFSDLKSFFVSGAFYNGKNIIRANIFSGVEKTYQAWDGVPGAILPHDRSYNGIGAYTNENGEQVYYDNETDNYQQDHYQLLFSRMISDHIHFNTALHYTYGRGYYEQYKEDQDLNDYLLDNITLGETTIETTDLIRRKWLDNHFYGFTYSFNYNRGRTDFVIGGGYNQYLGDHFGRVIWARYAADSEKGHEWYNGDGNKNDFNIYGKVNYQLNNGLNVYGDLQYRGINYEIDGTDDDLRQIGQDHNYNFVNPKLGFSYIFGKGHNAYFSFAVANREPNRSNFIDADENHPAPTHETLNDYEMGYNYKSHGISMNVNLYYMDYKDQLVMTGEINDVGSPIMTNVPKSYRMGMELVIGTRLTSFLKWEVNSTISRNKITNFTEYVDNWDYWEDMENEPLQFTSSLGTTDLAFSPGIIGASSLIINPFKDFEINIISKYVSRQYIDNTSSEERSLDPYFVNDMTMNYKINSKWFRSLNLMFQLNNIFNTEYETNAWIYRYYYQGEHHVMNGYFPQAGINFMAGLLLKI